MIEVAARGESGVHIEVKPWTQMADYATNPGERRVPIIESLRRDGVSIPFPQHEVRLIGGPQGRSRIVRRDYMSIDNIQVPRMQAAMRGTLRAHWALFLAEGIVLLLLGLGAVVLPPMATMAVEIIIGWLLLASGIVGLVSTFWMRNVPGFWWSLCSALIAVAAGFVLLRWPLSGALSLTFILTAFLFVEGVVSILYALDHRRELSGRWGMMLASGVIDLFLAGLIFLGLPATAAWAIGLLVGINLIFGGAALIAMALHARPAALP